MKKARIMHCDSGGSPIPSQVFYVQFNPSELSLVHTTGKYHKVTNDDKNDNNSSVDQQNTEEVSLTLKLFFNTFESTSQTTYQDVRELMKPFKEFCNYGITDEKQMEKICFHWGTMNIIGFLTAYQETYSIFSPDGKPVRAEVSLTINGKDDGYEKVTSSKIKEPEKKVETPFDKAMKTYNNPARWKEFASQDTDMRKILG